ncbi:MAG: hypothetical protein H0T73_19450 [Ardenticatenales bacterium]|nr:hypothetical protein [Ardenticatenales bacterium]
MRRSSPFIVVFLAVLVTFAIASPAAAFYDTVTGQLRNFNNGNWLYGATVEAYNCDTFETAGTQVVPAGTTTFSIDVSAYNALQVASYPICVEVFWNMDTANNYTPGNVTKGPFRNALAAAGSLNTGAYTAEAPLSVRLSSLTATAAASQIKVQWASASEVNNVGFNIYRSTTAEAPSQQMNNALIASQASGSSEGYSYEWADSAVQAGVTYYYWLEDVDANGDRKMSGPVSASPEAPTAVELSTLSAASTPMAGTLPLVGIGLLGLAAAGTIAWRRRR